LGDFLFKRDSDPGSNFFLSSYEHG